MRARGHPNLCADQGTGRRLPVPKLPRPASRLLRHHAGVPHQWIDGLQGGSPPARQRLRAQRYAADAPLLQERRRRTALWARTPTSNHAARRRRLPGADSDVRGRRARKSYKLRIHAPRPDFNILFNPAAVSVPKDGAMVASLECERREGFDGEIAVRVEGLPTGFSATPAVIEAGGPEHRSQSQRRQERKTRRRIFRRPPGCSNGSGRRPRSYARRERTTRGGASPSAGESKVRVVTDVREAKLQPGGEVVSEVRSPG